jgi:hypothetical protein
VHRPGPGDTLFVDVNGRQVPDLFGKFPKYNPVLRRNHDLSPIDLYTCHMIIQIMTQKTIVAKPDLPDIAHS